MFRYTSLSYVRCVSRRYGILIAAAAGALAFVAPTFAQTTGSSDASASQDSLQEVLVTATKTGAQKVLDVPNSIQAISSDTLQKQGSSGIMDVAGQIVGLAIEDLGPGDRKYIIRGISSTGESTTGVFYDEAVISGSNANDGGGFEPDIRLYDVDHIEVLRGPQGTLYGAGSMSGTIRFVTKKPDLSSVDGYADGEYSSTDHASGNWNINGALNLPIVNDQLALRMVGWSVYDSGYIDQVRIGTVGLVPGVNDDQVGGGRLSLRYKPLENLTFDASMTSQTERSDGPSLYTPSGVTSWGDPAVPSLKPIPGCDLCNTDVARSPWGDILRVFSLTGEYQASFGTFTGTTNQYDRKLDFALDSTPILVGFGIPIEAETYEPQTRDVNSSELRFASTFNSPVNFVVGAFRQHESSDLTVMVVKTNGLGFANGPFETSNSDDALSNPNGNTFFGRADHREITQNAGFGEATWKATDQLTFLAGVRYFTESLSGVQAQLHPFGGFPAGSSSVAPTPDVPQSYSRVTPKFNASYKFNDQVLMYATAAEGFRGGGLNAQSEPFEPIPGSFAPDWLWNYELGAKGRLFDGGLDYQADVYTLRWSNIQVNETTPTGGFNYTGNAGDAKVNGVELELDAHPMRYLKVMFSGSYTDAYLTRGVTESAFDANPTLGLTGEHVPEVPKYQLYFGGDYTAPISGNVTGTLAADVTYRSSEDSYFESNTYNVPLRSYTLLGVRASITSGPWTVMLFGKNLTDNRAQISAVNNTVTPLSLITIQPRTIGINVSRKF
jgi:iron complex outermembrane recepter protein